LIDHTCLISNMASDTGYHTAKQRSDAAKIHSQQKLMGTFPSVAEFFPAIRKAVRSKAGYFVSVVSILTSLVSFLGELARRAAILAAHRGVPCPAKNGDALFEFTLKILDEEIHRLQHPEDVQAAEALLMFTGQDVAATAAAVVAEQQQFIHQQQQLAFQQLLIHQQNMAMLLLARQAPPQPQVVPPQVVVTPLPQPQAAPPPQVAAAPAQAARFVSCQHLYLGLMSAV